MKARYSLAILAVAAVVSMPINAWACGGAGSNTHVGSLQSVDVKAKSFTIIDAQTHNPITLTSNDAVLKSLKDAKGMVRVLYEPDGNALKAVDVRF